VQTHDESGMYMWSLQRPEKHGAVLDSNQPSGLSLSAALNAVTGARVAYDVHHNIPWAQYVSLYLWTKSMAAGVFLVTWLFAVLSFGKVVATPPLWMYWLGPLEALIALAVTGVLLIADLDQPTRFWMILARPQWKSWLAIGSYIILFYSLLLVADLGLYLCGSETAKGLLVWSYYLTMPLAVMTAVYTAFLFAQAKGRDLWQSPLLPLHLLVQALLAGSALMVLNGCFIEPASAVSSISAGVLLAALLSHLFLFVFGELLIEHSSKAKQRALDLMVKGSYSKLFWSAAVLAGSVLPVILLVGTMLGIQILPPQILLPVAAVLALAGMLAFEHCYVMAGQSIRLS
jgi:formate-dependent nitrite reductase membrane component NrfD